MNQAVIFLDITVVFNISSSHANTNSPNKNFLHKPILISKYSSSLHVSKCIYNSIYHKYMYIYIYVYILYIHKYILYIHTYIHTYIIIILTIKRIRIPHIISQK